MERLEEEDVVKSYKGRGGEEGRRGGGEEGKRGRGEEGRRREG